MTDSFTLLGYRTNPYQYVKNCGLFVCASLSEGFSTAATEALIVGTPVCTTRVSGMDELLGDNEFGLITENNEEALYAGIKQLLDDPKLLERYRQQAKKRGTDFSTEYTVGQVQMFLHHIA
jgi:glycosyltransferase involved in cell wall biosynthesis